jgi:ubiquitin carboxyl-terminal hydrolase 7
MNSMLQALSHLPRFRSLIYAMDAGSNRPDDVNVPLNLQRLFVRMQLSPAACLTQALTMSFGWGNYETVMEHDVQELFSTTLR